MADAPITRRLLLGHGLAGSALLPLALRTAQAAPRATAAPARTVPLVVLDPGHGGKDPGAIGVSGTYEKHIAIATAQQLQHMLEADGRYRVMLTRNTDVFIPLAERVARAQAASASLFMSMHADSVDDSRVRGASVYTLAGAASDAQTERLALRENNADHRGGSAFANQPPEVANILASLVRRETRLGSARMQHSVVGALDADVPLLANPARHAAFAVLKAADIPSVLVEMGFMSNPTDEAALRRTDHRTRVAAALRRAVDGYFTATATQVAG